MDKKRLEEIKDSVSLQLALAKKLNFDKNTIELISEEIELLDYINDLQQRIEKTVEYIEKYLHEHVIDDLPDEESKFEHEDGVPIPNAKEILLNILKGDDTNE